MKTKPMLHIQVFSQNGTLLKELTGKYNVLCYSSETDITDEKGETVFMVANAIVMAETVKEKEA